MSSSLSASQLHTVNMRDPLNRVLGLCCNSDEHLVPLYRLNNMVLPSLYCSTTTALPLTSGAYKQILVSFFLANLFLLISSLLGSKTAGPHTQFVQSFIEECVECSEQGSRGSILQFLPFTMVRESSTVLYMHNTHTDPGSNILSDYNKSKQNLDYFCDCGCIFATSVLQYKVLLF